MTQDTRKDRRVKIVSLNVRYKSATVDEFIENHAHDVSRGGIYIKTANPFPPGTLLKFEIRLASDQAVIAGVGRVVWKRDASQGTGERPAGMGVKFIKIDEPSKGVIDRLVNTKADAGSAYESEMENGEPVAAKAEPAPAPTPAPAAAAAAAASAPTPEPKLTPFGGIAAPAQVRKATMMGIGAVTGSTPPAAPEKASAPAPAPAPAAAAAKGGGGGMFPEAKPEADGGPKQEQTVMKQAAELLEEALREAGGSMEEIGTNPLFSGTPGEAEAKPAAAQAEDKKPSTRPAADRPAEKDEAAKARAMVAEMAPAPKRVTSEPPRTTRESPSAKRPTSDAPPARAVSGSRKKGGSSTFVVVFLGVLVLAGLVVMFRDRLFGAGDTPYPSPQATTTPPTPTTAVTAPPSATATESATASAGSAASSAPSASASASASAAPTVAATGKPGPGPRPTATAAAATATAAPTVAATAPTATATPTAAPTATDTSAAPTATATAKPRPRPTAKPADDNPY
jgi:uncharacterized protein (TIGR02266 family)